MSARHHTLKPAKRTTHTCRDPALTVAVPVRARKRCAAASKSSSRASTTVARQGQAAVACRLLHYWEALTLWMGGGLCFRQRIWIAGWRFSTWWGLLTDRVCKAKSEDPTRGLYCISCHVCAVSWHKWQGSVEFVLYLCMVTKSSWSCLTSDSGPVGKSILLNWRTKHYLQLILDLYT
jgi:hypothetical protein